MKDWRGLAGTFGYTDAQVRNFEKDSDQTLAFLRHWWASNCKEKTVSLLIDHLKAMERDDAADLLEPYKYDTSDCKYFGFYCCCALLVRHGSNVELLMSRT